MQRITKFSAIIGFLAVLTFAVGFFMFTPSFTGHGVTVGASTAFACCGTSGGGGGGGGNPPPPPPPPPAPACTLNAAPTTINQGQSSTLTWTTTNASSISIDQSIGAVAANGNTSVSPSVTKTYTLTATGNGQTVHCSKTITVIPPVVPDPVCTLSAAPLSITNGQSATLSWTTSNASSVSIDHSIGSVSANGNTSVSPTQTTTYTLTAIGNGKTVTCAKTIVVTTVNNPDPVCALDAAPTSIVNGQSSTLSWTTQNASTISIDHTIGSVSANGNTSVSPSQTTTYTLTATGHGKTVTCVKTIVVTTVNTPGLSCDAFYATPATLGVGGGNTTLVWNTTGAVSVSIDQGVGSVPVDDSRVVSVSSSKTFTLTATASDGRTTTCSTPVSVQTGGGGGGGGGGHGGSGPHCEYLHTTENHINTGDSATLSWQTLRGDTLDINPDVISTEDHDRIRSGSVMVRPTHDTKYTLRVSREGRSSECDLTIYVDDALQVTSIRDRQPLTTVSLKYVPYTGFDADPIITGFFYTLLALWSLGVAYVLVVKQGSVFGFSLATVGMTRRTPFASPIVARVATPAFVPANLPVATDDDEEEEVTEDEDNEEEEEVMDESFATLENHAYKSSVMLSKDALKVIAQAADTTDARITLLNTVIARAIGTYPREDGWISLNRERISHLF